MRYVQGRVRYVQRSLLRCYELDILEAGCEPDEVSRVLPDEALDGQALASGIAVPLAILGDSKAALVVDADEMAGAHGRKVDA